MRRPTPIQSFSLLLALAGSLAACTAKDNSGSRGSGSTSAAVGTLEGASRNTGAAQTSPDSGMQPKMSGMPGMSGASGMGGMMSGVMMDSMQTHIRMMNGMNPSQINAALQMHRQMTANMLSRMNSEMRTVNMPSDARWSATADSVRQDLKRMPEMSAQELKAFMPLHSARLTRLMATHREMMKQTRP